MHEARSAFDPSRRSQHPHLSPLLGLTSCTGTIASRNRRKVITYTRAGQPRLANADGVMPDPKLRPAQHQVPTTKKLDAPPAPTTEPKTFPNGAPRP
jgi:hypothetical protein